MSLIVYCGYNDSGAKEAFWETSSPDEYLYYGSRLDPAEAKTAALILVEASKSGEYVIHTINPYLIDSLPVECLCVYVDGSLLDIDPKEWRFLGLLNRSLMAPEFTVLFTKGEK